MFLNQNDILTKIQPTFSTPHPQNLSLQIISVMNQADLFSQLQPNVLSSVLAALPDDSVKRFLADNPALGINAIPEDRARRLLAPLKALPQQQAKSSGHQQPKKYTCGGCDEAGHTIVKCTKRCSCCDVLMKDCSKRTRAPKRIRARQEPSLENESYLPTLEPVPTTMSNAEFLASLNADSVATDDDDDDSGINHVAEPF